MFSWKEQSSVLSRKKKTKKRTTSNLHQGCCAEPSAEDRRSSSEGSGGEQEVSPRRQSWTRKPEAAFCTNSQLTWNQPRLSGGGSDQRRRRGDNPNHSAGFTAEGGKGGVACAQREATRNSRGDEMKLCQSAC